MVVTITFLLKFYFDPSQICLVIFECVFSFLYFVCFVISVNVKKHFLILHFWSFDYLQSWIWLHSSFAYFCPRSLFPCMKVKVKVVQSCLTFPLRGLYSLWNSPDENTAVGSVSLLQGIFPTQGLNPGVPHCRRIPYQLSLVGSHFWYSHVGVLWCLGLDYLPSPKISIDIYFCQLLVDTNTWLRYNLQTIKFTHFKCTIQLFLLNLRNSAVIIIVQFGTFLSPMCASLLGKLSYSS